MEKKRPVSSIRPLIWRGLRKKCPHCGRGNLFRKRVNLYELCPVCGLRILRNQGDPWAFLLIVDRALFIFPIIVALYFGLFQADATTLSVFFGGVGLLFVLTTPNRYGLCIAIDYWTRLRWGDPSDRLPELED